MADIRGTTAVLGITSTLVLSGINIATSLLFVPRMYPLPIATSTAIFDKLYHNGAQVVVPLAGVGITSFAFLSYYDAYYRHHRQAISPGGSSTALGVAAGLVVCTLAWTKLLVMPVNDQLLGMAHDAHSREEAGPAVVQALLRKWKWMNYVRGFVALGAGVLALTAVV